MKVSDRLVEYDCGRFGWLTDPEGKQNRTAEHDDYHLARISELMRVLQT